MHQFVLDEPSRNITIFYGRDGLYRYKRLSYKTKSAQDILQLEMHKMMSGIPNQVNIADDISIDGSVEERDAVLQKVLSALISNGITVNPDKCVFDVEDARFVCLVFNKHGTKPDPKNVRNLQDASQPTSKESCTLFAEFQVLVNVSSRTLGVLPTLCGRNSKRASGHGTERAKKHL